MPLKQPILTKRIPTPPWGDPADRKLVTLDHFLETGATTRYAKRSSSTPKPSSTSSKPASCVAEAAQGSPRA